MALTAPSDQGARSLAATPARLVAADEGEIAEAALTCIARWGIAKTTIDDVAREAGCSRATLYRRFPGGKDALFRFAFHTEIGLLLEDLRSELDPVAEDLEALLTTGIQGIARRVAEHESLRLIHDHDAAAVLPALLGIEVPPVVEVAVAFAAPYLVPFVGADRAPGAAELIGRLVHSYTLIPSPSVDLTVRDDVVDLVGTYLLPAFRSLTEENR